MRARQRTLPGGYPAPCKRASSGAGLSQDQQPLAATPRAAGPGNARVLLGSQEGSNEPEQLDALEQCGRFALSQGSREKAGPALAVVEEADLEQPAGGHVVNVNGLNVYGSAAIDGTDRGGLRIRQAVDACGHLDAKAQRSRGPQHINHKAAWAGQASRRGKVLLGTCPLRVRPRGSPQLAAHKELAQRFIRFVVGAQTP